LQACAPDGRLVLACPSRWRLGEQTGFALWRQPGGRPWDADELILAASATGIIRVILEHDAVQREMARQARTDPLTTLINRRAFLDEVARRIERLEREGLPGTLLFVDLDKLKTGCEGMQWVRVNPVHSRSVFGVHRGAVSALRGECDRVRR
jgi:hypothetical protein